MKRAIALLCLCLAVSAALAQPANPERLKQLTDSLHKGYSPVAARELLDLGEPGFAVIKRALERGGRHAALAAYTLCDKPAPQAEPLLRPLLTDKDPVAGYWAAKALGRLKSPASAAALAAMLPEKEDYFYEFSFGGKHRLRSEAGGRIVKMPMFAPDDMPNIRVSYAALLALGEIGGRQAQATLERALDNRQYLIRQAAAAALGTMKASALLGRLEQLAVGDGVLIVRQAARTAVEKIRGSYKTPDDTPPPMPPALLLIQSKNRTESNLGFRDSYPYPLTPWYGWGENLFLLSPVAPNGTLKNLTNLTNGAVQGPEVSYDGKKILFAMRKGMRTDGFHIYEMNVDGGGLRQLTSGHCNDVDPCYLGDGRIAFASDRAGYREYYHQERSRVIYVMDGDGSHLEQISFNPNQDYEPLALSSGEIVYGSYRFYGQDGSPGPLPGEYFLHRIETVLRTMRPDGTQDGPFYGSLRGSFFVPLRPTPDSLQDQGWHPRGNHIGVAVSQHRELSDGRIVCITPAGLTVVDPALPPTDCETPLYPEVLNLAGGERVYIHAHDNLNPVGRYTTPCPAGGQWVFVSHAPWYDLRKNGYGLYLLNLQTRRQVLVYDNPEVSEIEPVAVVARPAPAVTVSQLREQADPTGLIFCSSVFNSALEYDRAKVRSVRVLGALFEGLSINANASFRSRVLGTVPIQADGSFYVRVPADTPIRFELLDADENILVHETEFNSVRPGEVKGCAGCHESRSRTANRTLPAGRLPEAMRKAPALALPKRGDLIFQGRAYRTHNVIVRD
ncbi:MAG: translocation protein TolB [Planctomycetes bacterium ADurb.Bin126]|nr:MAG: translocation protein TolB [Planctomycetes bacterium ADurb.Bin126]